MTRMPLTLPLTAVLTLASAMAVRGQGGEWTTSRFDAQQTAWVRADERLTKDAVTSGNFKFLWRAELDNETRQLNALTPPVILDRLIGYRGFKALAFVGGSADRVFAIDTDLNRPYWTAHLTYSAATGGQPPSTWLCPGGLTATPTRRTNLAPSAFGRGGGGGRGARSGSAVGEPGQGAAVLAQQRGRGPAPAAPPPAGPARGARAAVPPVPFGGVDPIYAVGSDGLLRTLRASNGSEAAAPIPFLPPDVRASALIWIDGVVYTTTSHDCGAVPNAIWALDTTTPEHKVTKWETGGADFVGGGTPAFAADGTLFVTLGAEPVRRATVLSASAAPVARHAHAVVALDRETLTVKNWFSVPGLELTSPPIVVRRGNRDLVAVTASDGKLYLLDAAALGGADHRTAVAVSDAFTAPGAMPGLATWQDASTQWILATSGAAPAGGAAFAGNGVAAAGSVVAFRLVEKGGTLAVEPAWRSRNVPAPTPPTVVNGLVFVAASGEHRPAGEMSAAARASRSTNGVLYALDGASGKELWNSGLTIRSFVRGGIVAAAGQVYLVTYDNRLYAFGVPMEH
ncbi:MAG: PQQ-binding-like beta-propeller repeat protein [Acidobacteria bacterium]|nr:PQQ-binding-like beta-propeller repeat protein [Acidobacteriota bacterium]